jgi:hypothetical protein
MMHPSIYAYIKTEEAAFQSDQIRLGDNWDWNFRDHVQLIFHLKNGIFYTGENNWLRAFKNIMEPMMNLAYWTEDIELKDVVFYIESENGRALSFLMKKYHDEIFAKEHNLDTLIDEITESDLDYGGALVQNTDSARPEVFQLNSIAFCDQTDITGGPIGFKHYFAPDKLRQMSKLGWGDEKNGATISIEDLCILAQPEKDPAGLDNAKTNRLPGKNIEVYIVRGTLPDHYLKDNNDMEYHCKQVQVVAFYTNKENKKEGVTLYRKEESEDNLKFFTSKKVHGRALGRGVGESMLHPQIWTNFLTIHKTRMLEAASKVPLYTDDQNYTNRNKIQDMENLEITTVEEGRTIQQVPTAAPNNIVLMEKSINEWFEHAQLEGAAFDPILGKEPVSGTTFRGQERTVAQGRGLHDRRRGQRAKFIEEIYRDWIIPHIARQITKGKKFLATLTAEEMAWLTDQLAENYANSKQIEALLNLEKPVDKEMLRQEFREQFGKRGNKQLIEILKDEFKDIEIKMGINVASKQKDLFGLTDKLLSIFQFVFANPAGFQQTMRIPGMAKMFGDILEYSGLSQADFHNFMNTPVPAAPVESQPAQTPGKPQLMAAAPAA